VETGGLPLVDTGGALLAKTGGLALGVTDLLEENFIFNSFVFSLVLALLALLFMGDANLFPSWHKNVCDTLVTGP
jgi:predicted lysophospholipase L1 biosynthesis ABC-type transport system permease subunit